MSPCCAAWVGTLGCVAAALPHVTACGLASAAAGASLWLASAEPLGGDEGSVDGQLSILLARLAALVWAARCCPWAGGQVVGQVAAGC